MAKHCIRIAALAATIGLAMPFVAVAEVLGPMLSKGTLEVGVMERRVERELERGGQVNERYIYDYPATIRYGVTERATVSCELSAQPNTVFFDNDLVQFTVGAGVCALVWSPEGFVVSTGFHYYRRLIVFQQTGWCDEVTHGIDWALLGQRALAIGGVDIDLWGGPTISYLIVEPQAPCDETGLTPSNASLGGVVGTTLTSQTKIVLQGSLVRIDNLEYRLNLGFRF